MNILKRIKNLWELSEYQPRPSIDLQNSHARILEKDFFPVRHKLATIIPEEKKDIFQEDEENTQL